MLIPVRYGVRLVAAVLLAGVGPLLGPLAGPADAAVCSSDSGVTVVVDFHELGGGVQTVCDPDGGGKTAATLFPANGFPLDYVQRQPGFVCRVSGKPADDPCVNTPPADAYWGLFWSNGTSGQWSYASSGAGSQRIPDGGSVAFSWQGSTNRAYPGVTPPKHSSQPSPHPSSKPSGGGGSGSTGGPATGTAGPTTGAPTASPTRAATAHHHEKSRHEQKSGLRKHHHSEPSSSPSPTAESSSAQPMAEGAPPPSDGIEPDDSGGMPGWIPLVAIGVLFATAVGVGMVQRRRS